MRKLIIVGTTRLTDRLIEAVDAAPEGTYAILGVVGERPGATTIKRYPMLGTLADLDRIVQRLRPDVVALTLNDALSTRTSLESRAGTDLVVEDGVEMYEGLTGTVPMETLKPGGLMLDGQRRLSRGYIACTRVIGIIVSLTGLIVLSPLLFLIAAAIAFDSDGPIIFAQLRGGQAGRPFRMLKFRTMCEDDRRTSEWVQDNGNRITRVGRWLRKYRLDELPQLLNVLRGEMNLVGPRPHPVSNIATLQQLTRSANDPKGTDVPYYTVRLLVPPGITGWSQVRYGYASSFAEEIEKLRYDLYYIKRVSLGFDLRILFETIRVVLQGRDAELVTRVAHAQPAVKLAA
jgi:lipopolysaccharide/colanic/teichoic acid biosynthesis glycosyltransferase